MATTDSATTITVRLPNKSPYELERDMLRDGRPRDVLSQRIGINDVVRIWTVQTGWSSPREYFVKHIIPKWVPDRAWQQDPSPTTTTGVFFQSPALTSIGLPKGYVMYTFLLVPNTETLADATNVGEDAINIYSDSVLIITSADMIVIEEGMAQDAIKVVTQDYQVVKLRQGEINVIYNTDADVSQGQGAA